MKKWKNITINLPGINLYPLIDYFSNFPYIYSISIKDKLPLNKSYWFDDPSKRITLNGDNHLITFMMEFDYKINELLYLIKTFLNLDEEPSYYEEIFSDRDWIQYTQSQFKEIMISTKFRIIPPWINQNNFSGKTIIIDPGRGFGIGTHPTTKLCLKWIENNINQCSTLLDYGSGSGILSIAAKLFDANLVEGVEIDKNAIKNSKINNQLNKLNISYYNSNTFKTKKKYNVIISNILLPTLIELSNKFKNLASKKIVISGILDSQTQELIKTYDWINLEKIDEMNDWVLLFGQLKS